MATTRERQAQKAPASVEELHCVCRRIVYGVLARGLHPPTPAVLGELRAMPPQLLVNAAQELVEEPTNLAVCARRVAEALGTLDDEALRDAYGRLFGHTARGQVCPYETEFGPQSPFEQSACLGDVSGLYAAFGVVPSRLARERVDHIGCELEFLEFLSSKETYAIQCADHDMIEATRKAMRLFLRDHVGRFARAFSHKLARADASGWYGRLARLLDAFVQTECARVGVTCGPSYIPLRSAEDDAVPMQCGSCDTTACDEPAALSVPSRQSPPSRDG